MTNEKNKTNLNQENSASQEKPLSHRKILTLFNPLPHLKVI